MRRALPSLIFLLLALSAALAAAPQALAGAKAKRSGKAAPAAGIEISCPQKAVIGEPFVLRVRSPRPLEGASLRFLGRSAPLFFRKDAKGYAAAIVLGADVLDARPGSQAVELRTGPGAKPLRSTLELVAIKRPLERLELDPDMVNPPASELPRIAAERARARETLARSGSARLWSLPFFRPVAGAESSPYGIGRVLNGVPKAPHRGLDLEASVGDPVAAAADGVVAIAGSFYYAGNCVYLDHGQGLFTMYFHLSELRVAEGQKVSRGQVIGLAGDTGRSTRAHLHFGVSSLGRLVDPAPLFLYDANP